MNDLIRQVHAKYNAYVEHAVQVAIFSTRLFLELERVHGLGERERHLLTQAAYLHDIGHFVHKKKHHKHSYHLILHDRLLDEWDEETREIIALLALNHRKKKTLLPDELQDPLRGKILSLAALLRIADVLDYEHEQKTTIERVHVDGAADGITITISGMPVLVYEQKLRDKLQLACTTWNTNITLQNGPEQITVTP